MHIGKDSIPFYNKTYKQLIGWKIKDFKMVQCEYDTSQYWPTFIIQAPIKEGGFRLRLILSQDEEGNGGGFAFIEDDQPSK